LDIGVGWRPAGREKVTVSKRRPEANPRPGVRAPAGCGVFEQSDGIKRIKGIKKIKGINFSVISPDPG
jgi:hypothetical protein